MMDAHNPRAFPQVVRFLLALTVVACGGDATGSDQPLPGTVTVTLPQTVFVGTGRSTSISVGITRQGGRADALTLSAETLPTGVTVAFNPPVLTGGTLSSTATFTAATDATPVSAPVLIRATGTDGYYGVNGTTIVVSRPTITIAKNGTGTGTVTSSPAGINCGGTCSSSFPNGTDVTLTATAGANSLFAGWSGGNCSGTSTCLISSINVGQTITATFNSSAQSFSVAANAPTTSLQQGGSATATVSISRLNGYAGAVAFTTTGAPTGLTITAPASVTGNSATINIAAASSVPVGSYPINVSATGAGITGTQAVGVTVQVTAGPGGSGNVSFSFANCDPGGVPIWFATQNGSGAWSRVTMGSNATFTFTPATATGVAWVVPDGPGFSTSVLYASGDEITSIALGGQCSGANAVSGTKNLSGTLASFGGFATVTIGGASATEQSLQGQGFMLNSVAAGRRDLIATSNVTNANGFINMQKLILRRNVSYTTTIPQLNFGSSEAVVPPQIPVTRNNLGTDQPAIAVQFITANGASDTYYNSPGGVNFSSYYGVPDTLLQAGDFHEVTNFATPPSGSSFRIAISLRHAAVQDTVTFGPALSQPTVTTLGSSPYLRMRAVLPSQTAYNAGAVAEYSLGFNSVSLTTTTGYYRTLPASWTIDVPDFTSAGYDPNWGMKSGSPDWQVTAAAGDILPLIGGTPFEGARAIAAITASSSGVRAQRARRIRWR